MTPELSILIEMGLLGRMSRDEVLAAMAATGDSTDGLEAAMQDVHYWQRKGTSFNCQILSLLQKADMENIARLRQVYPMLVLAWSIWNTSPSQAKCFENWALHVDGTD